MDPAQIVPLGSTGLTLTRLGFGAAGIGRDVATPDDALECVEMAWASGVRYFDVAPMYANGRAEIRLGEALRSYRRDDYVLSSKVGRLVDDPKSEPDGAGSGWHFDYSGEAVRRSIAESLDRLGLDRLDIVFIHDPDHHWREAIDGAYPVLEDLRRQGVIRAIGAGMTQAEMLARFVRETDIDVTLVAGRYSLLDTTAAADLLPESIKRGRSVIVAQALHGGLIDGVPNPQIYYRPIDPETAARRDAIAAVCHRHGIPTAAAAIQFPFGSPAVTSLLTGPMKAAQLRDNLAWFCQPVPDAVWSDLADAGLIAPGIPTPSNRPEIVP